GEREEEGGGEWGGGGVGDRRLDQCRAALARHCPRMRLEVRPVRRRRCLQKDTVCRGFETEWPLCCQRYVRSRRRSALDEDAARPRVSSLRMLNPDLTHRR